MYFFAPGEYSKSHIAISSSHLIAHKLYYSIQIWSSHEFLLVFDPASFIEFKLKSELNQPCIVKSNKLDPMH